VQVAYFEVPPGLVHDGSPPEAKLAFFGAPFAARTDVYAPRYDNPRTGARRVAQRGLARGPRLPAAHSGGAGGWRRTSTIPGAMFDALMYVKAGRVLQVPVALEVSRSGIGAHAWVFFTSPVPVETTRRLGAGLLREVMALRGRMNLASYDRLFPSLDLLPAGGMGNLIAARCSGPPARPGNGVPGPGDPGAVRGPVGLPVYPWPDDATGGQARGRAGRSRSRQRRPG
jgi:hypothetical protein